MITRRLNDLTKAVTMLQIADYLHMSSKMVVTPRFLEINFHPTEQKQIELLTGLLKQIK